MSSRFDQIMEGRLIGPQVVTISVLALRDGEHALAVRLNGRLFSAVTGSDGRLTEGIHRHARREARLLCDAIRARRGYPPSIVYTTETRAKRLPW